MELTINIEDYITPDEIKSIAMEELRRYICNMYHRDENNINRLISNLSYEFVFKAVSDAIGTNAEEMIANKVKKLCQDDGAIRYEMWKKKDAWQKDESPAVEILNRAIKDNEDLIRVKVMQAIDQFEFHDVQTAMYEALDNCVRDIVFGRRG